VIEGCCSRVIGSQARGRPMGRLLPHRRLTPYLFEKVIARRRRRDAAPDIIDLAGQSRPDDADARSSRDQEEIGTRAPNVIVLRGIAGCGGRRCLLRAVRFVSAV